VERFGKKLVCVVADTAPEDVANERRFGRTGGSCVRTRWLKRSMAAGGWWLRFEGAVR
jgi:hypothetical protein